MVLGSSAWDIIQPTTRTINYVPNPSFEYGTSGWSTQRASFVKSTAGSRFGASCGRMLSASSLADGTVFMFTSQVVSSATNIVGSAWVRADSTQVSIAVAVGSGAAGRAHSGSGDWERLQVTLRTTESAIAELAFVDSRIVGWTNVDIDGAQLEVDSTAASTYIDGEQDDCVWLGTVHGSKSMRNDYVKSGGRIVGIDTLTGVNVRAHAGTGMPPLANIMQEYGQLPGSIHQRTVKRARTFTLTSQIRGTTLANLHANRAALLALVSPDTPGRSGPIRLRYSGVSAQKPLEIDAVYDAGLELGDVIGAGLERAVPLRFIAPDPDWKSVTDRGASLGTIAQLSLSSDILMKRTADGTWSVVGVLGVAAGSSIDTMVVGQDGYLYVGGNFATLGGVTCNNVARINMDDGGIATVGGTQCNGAIYSCTMDQAGNIYMCGTFTIAPDGTAANRIAKWNGTAWSALGGGFVLGNIAYDIVAAPNISGPEIYAGGSAAGGGFMQKWNGVAWSDLGTVPDNAVYSIAFDPTPSGVLYAGGAFTQIGGVSALRGAAWNGSAWAALGTGFSAQPVTSVRMGPDGNPYFFGGFTTANGVTVNRICYWNGVTFIPQANGIYSTNNWGRIAFDKKGNLYVLNGGLVPYPGLGLPSSIAKWNGAAWLDIDLATLSVPGDSIPGDMVFAPDGSMYLSLKHTGAATSPTPYAMPIVSLVNSGSAAAYPIIRIRGSSAYYLYSIWNYTTGEEIHFYNLILNAGEVFTLDLRPGHKTFESNYRGSLLGYIIPSSDFATFHLAPGTNTVRYQAASGACLIDIFWRERFWSSDGSAS